MGIVDKLIHRYKTRKKQSFLQQPLYHSRHQYAFIGVGMHSLANLYPLLHNFNVSAEIYLYRYVGRCAGTRPPKFPASAKVFDPSSRRHPARPRSRRRFCLRRAPPKPFFHRPAAPAGRQTRIRRKAALLFAFTNSTTLIVKREKDQGSANPHLRGGSSKKNKVRPTIAADQEKIKCTATHYHYTYGMGPYPEGDPIYELFIHPVDNQVCNFSERQRSNG